MDPPGVGGSRGYRHTRSACADTPATGRAPRPRGRRGAGSRSRAPIRLSQRPRVLVRIATPRRMTPCRRFIPRRSAWPEASHRVASGRQAAGDGDRGTRQRRNRSAKESPIHIREKRPGFWPPEQIGRRPCGDYPSDPGVDVRPRRSAGSPGSRAGRSRPRYGIQKPAARGEGVPEALQVTGGVAETFHGPMERASRAAARCPPPNPVFRIEEIFRWRV